MITPQRLRIYPWLVLVASWSIIAINFITRRGWRGGFGQIIGQDFLTLYSAGWLYRQGIQHLYDLAYQGGVEQALISPTTLEGVNPYISPPYVALAYSPFTLLSLPAAFAVWQVISLLCALVAAAWLVRLMPPRLLQTGLRGWQWSIVLLSFFPLVQGWLVGQNHTLTLLLLTGVLLFTLQDRPVLAGAMAGLTFFKPQFALGFLIVWIVWRQWKSLLAFAGVAVVWAGLVVLQHGIGSYQTYFTGIDDILQIQSMPGFPDYMLVTSVLSTALSFLDLYRDPILAQNTAVSDFALEDLVSHERPVSLYLTVPPSDLSRTRLLVRLLLNQACRRLTERMDFTAGRGRGAGKHPLLLMLDEFPALGKLQFFQESLAYLAGYDIRAMLITQDLSQHQGVYGKQESITANCHVRIAFAANKPETAELLSQMAGDTTVSHKQVSYRGASTW